MHSCWRRSCCLGLGLRVGRGLGRARAGLRRGRLRDDRRQSRPGEGFTLGARRDPARKQLLARPAAACGRRLQGHGRRPRTHGAGRPGPARHARGPLHLPDRPPALGTGRRTDRRRGGGDLPGAARVPGDADERAVGGDAAVGGGAGDASGRDGAGTEARRPARRRPTGSLARGSLLGALALVRPEYLGVALLVSLVVLASGVRADWRRALAQAAILLVGVAVVVAPWTIRNAVALDRFVPISTGGGQVLFAGTYLPSDGDPEKVGAEVVARHPGAVRPGRRPEPAAGADPRPAGRAALSRSWKPTRRSRGWGANSSGTTSAKSRSNTPGSSPPRSGGSGRTGRAT